MNALADRDFDTEAFCRRLVQVRERIAAACARARRSPETVRLLGVTKGVGPEAVAAALDAGIEGIGENRVQEAVWKKERLGSGGVWHMIGHLQRNKARAALECFDWLHAVDSLRLLETLEHLAEAEGFRPTILLEINVSGESSKFGLSPDAAPAVIERALECRALDLVGLMTLAPFNTDPEASRPVFETLRACRDRWAERFGTPLPELSMGMSGDFEPAVECGATLLRVGSALFGPRLSWAQLQTRMRQAEGLLSEP